MKPVALLAFAFAWLVACETPPSAPTSQPPSVIPPSFTVLFNQSLPFSDFAFNSCPPPEVVEFDGRGHEVITGETGPGSQDITFHFNTQDVKGVGLTSGDAYEVPDNEKEDFVFTSLPLTFDDQFDMRFRLIRAGSADNLWIRQTVETSFPPFNVQVKRNQIECRG